MHDNLLDNEIPEKFKDTKTGALNTGALLKSYTELESKMSEKPSVPKTPEEYCIKCEHGMFEPDEEINKRLHEKDFTQEQAQEVYDLAAEKFVPMISEVSADLHAERELEKLINHFGGAESWQEVSRQLLAFGKKSMSDDILDGMASTFEGVLALEKMMQSDEPGLKGDAQISEATSEKDLKVMMRDPRYWKQKDPAFVAKVTKGFEKIYGK